jgi:GMC oxidoreductase
MGRDARTSVVDGFGRSHDISNLFICDGSILPTKGSANPGLTIQVLAARTADYLISQPGNIFTSNRRDLSRPPVRRHLSPPGNSRAGNTSVLERLNTDSEAVESFSWSSSSIGLYEEKEG